MSWVDQYRFDDPFIDLRDQQERASLLAAELQLEVGSGHPLAGKTWTVVAEAMPQDEVLVVNGEQAALVHLTWRRKQETPPWPTCEVVTTPEDFGRLIEFRY